MARGRSGDDPEDARRILTRIAREANADTMPALGPAADAPKDDWAEIWGTRIGRVLGPLLLVLAGVWLLFRLRSGG